MKRILIILLLTPFWVLSQTLKTYSGEFYLQYGPSNKGIANYTYFENDKFERIYDGKFSFSNQQVGISGQFKNGLRTGMWKFTWNDKEWLGPYIGNNEPFNITTTVYYINGKLNGDCTYKNVNPTTKKIMQSSSATFKNNVLIGKYEFDSFFDREYKYTIRYECDSVGHLTGDYKLTYRADGIPVEDLRKYDNGKLKIQVFRDITTGKKPEFINNNWDLERSKEFWFYEDSKTGKNGLSNSNIIYFSTDGLNLEDFETPEEKSENIRLDAQNREEKEEEDMERTKKFMGLKTVIDSSITWEKVSNSNFSISSYPLTARTGSGYYFYLTYKTEANYVIATDDCIKILQDGFKGTKSFDGLVLKFDYTPDKLLTEEQAKGLSNWLGYKIATEKEIETAKQSGIYISPAKNKDGKLFYFIKVD